MVHEEAIEVIYYCDYCNFESMDEDHAEGHEEDCDKNPKVVAELKRLADIAQAKKMGIEVPEEEPIVPLTLKATPEMLAKNLRMDWNLEVYPA